MHPGAAPGGGGDNYSKVTGCQEDRGAEDTCGAVIAQREDMTLMYQR